MGDRYRYARPRSPTLYNPGRASLPLDTYRDYPPSPVRSDHAIHSTPRRDVIPGPRSSNPIVTSGPITTTTYKVSADPISRTSSVREGSRTRRSTLDGAASKPSIVTSSRSYRPRDRPVIHAGNARPPSPVHDPYRSSQEEYYAVPASSSRRHHHQPRYSATMDNADMNRLSSERDSGHHLRAGAPPVHAYPRSRPVYSGPVVPYTADYADDGYGYTTPRDLVQWDLNNAAAVPRHTRNSSYDRGRPSSITGYSDIAPVRPVDNRPPPSTRGFDRIPQTARIAPSPYDRERDRIESRVSGPAPVEPVRPVAAVDGPRRGDSMALRPATYYHERERRSSNRDDYEVKEDEPRYRSERHRHDRRDKATEERATRTDRDEAARSERHERKDREHRSEKDRHDDDYRDHKRHDDEYKDHKRHGDDYKDHKRHDDDQKDRKDTKDHKARDAAVAGLSLAGAALGVKAFKESADDHDDRRDYDDDNRRRRDPRDDKDATERRQREDSPLRDSKDRPIEIVEPPARDPKERHGSRSGRDIDSDHRRPAEGPLNGTAIETESSASDETRPRRLKRRESGPAFNPRNATDLKALKEALNKEPAPSTAQQTPPKTRAESMSKDSRALTEIRSDVQSESGALRIVAPATSGADSKPPVKGILRAPREKFPEDPAPIREGVAPMKDAKKDGVPPSARWTKISRKLVNPEALELGKERYEAREDFVIVLRVLTRDEVQTYAEVTERIRTAREEAEEEEERAARRRARRDHHERHRRRRESGGEVHRSSAHSQRHAARDQDLHSESDTTSDSYAEKGDKVRSRRASKDRDRSKMKAIESGPVMSGGLGTDDRKQRGDEKKVPSKTDGTATS